MFKTSWYLKQVPKVLRVWWWVWHTWGWPGILDGQRSADSHLYCPTPESTSICAIGREAQQNGQMPKVTSMPAVFPCRFPRPISTSSVVASYMPVNHKWSERADERWTFRKEEEVSIQSHSICSRTNDSQLDSFTSGCPFWDKMKNNIGKW